MIDTGQRAGETVAVETVGLTKRYGSRVALDGVDLTVRAVIAALRGWATVILSSHLLGDV